MDLSLNKYILKDIDLLIFDKDGTIIDIHHYWVSMIKLRATRIVDLFFQDADSSKRKNHHNSLCETMGVILKTDKLSINGPVGIKPRPFIVGVVTKYLSDHLDKITDEEIEAIFKEVDHQTAKDLRPLLKLLPGVMQLLADAKEAGAKLAIATTDITSRALAAMSALEIDSSFDLIVGADQVAKSKPSPEIANLILNRLNISPEHAVFLGDHHVDIETGKSAGLHASIGVCTGLTPREELLKYTQYVIDTFEDIKYDRQNFH